MSPEIRTGLRRIITLLAGTAFGVIAYELHAFEGWAWRGMLMLDLVLLLIVIRLVMQEGRERERAERGW